LLPWLTRSSYGQEVTRHDDSECMNGIEFEFNPLISGFVTPAIELQ